MDGLIPLLDIVFWQPEAPLLSKCISMGAAAFWPKNVSTQQILYQIEGYQAEEFQMPGTDTPFWPA